jgi:hypothetical protein
MSVLGHMMKLIAEGRVCCDSDTPVVQSRYRLADMPG